MATSGSTNFTATRNEIIRQAALLVRAAGQGVTMSAELVNDFAFSLNAMVKHWQGRGLRVWTVSEGVLFPAQDQTRYATGTDHIAGSFVSTTLSADEAAGQTVLSVTAVTGMTAADFVGIVLDSGAIQWTTINTVGVSTITTNAALTGAASSGNAVFAYTSKITKPLRVVDARRRQVDDGTEIPIAIVSRQEYRAIPQKTGEGSINQMHYDPQLSTGYFHIWQVPAIVDEIVTFTYWRPIEDFDTGADNPDLPTEWIRCLYYNLAADMLPRYPVPSNAERMIRDTAAQALDDMEGWGREAESIMFQPDYGY